MALVNTFRPEHGNTPLHIDFYYNHVHSSTLFLKDDGTLTKAGWATIPNDFTTSNCLAELCE